MSRVSIRTFTGALAVVAGVLLGLVVPAGRQAQAQTADATVEVDVIDETGVALPGVSVELKRAETGYTRNAVTSARGSVRFPAVTPAPGYMVKVSLSGFEPVEQPATLRIGQTAKLKVTLRAKAVMEAITVVAEAQAVDVYKTDSSTNIVPEQIRDLPVANREFEKLAFIAPGVQRERGDFRFISGGPVIGSGGNASQSTILVDGVDYTDPALGLAKTRVSQDAISEFRVVNSRFDAEVGGSAGGALTILTKTGTNDFKGSAFIYYLPEAFRAKEYNELESDVEPRRAQGGLTLGGPIVKDKTHFFFSAEFVDNVRAALVRPGGAFATTNKVDAENPFQQTLAFGSVMFQLTDTMNLLAKGDYERYRMDNFRVGGIQDVSYGQELQRDNYNFTLAHSWTAGSATTNEARFQFGHRKYFEPMNSTAVGDWYSLGNTLRSGGNIVGDLLGEGDQFELRDTLYLHLSGKTGTHDLKIGAGWQHVKDRSIIDTYQNGLFLWLLDNKTIPYAYLYGVGSSDVTISTDRIAAFVQDDWRPVSNLTVSLGLRYDLDTDGNNPDFTHPMVPNARGTDTNNIQPRVGFSWDIKNDGAFVARGGWGIFTGRYLLVPAFTELQQNGVTGRKAVTRINGALFGLPAFTLDPNNPTTTGLPTAQAITLLDTTVDAPEANQTSLGLTTRLGRTGVYLDVEGVYAKGRNELINRDVNWAGNSNPAVRPNAAYSNINTYTNEGHSEYKALTVALNGTLKGGHLLTGSVTFADKKNLNDDFSPEYPTGYPNDPAYVEGEWGRARSTEKVHVVLSGVFRLPLQFTIAPIYQYGSGQPWTHRLGYDWNGDGFNSDRPAGVDRFAEDGPPYRRLDLRLTKAFSLGSSFSVDVIAEVFNVFNTVNYDVTSVDGAEYLRGTTRTAPLPANLNPNFGVYTRSIPEDSRRVQFGLRLVY
jgi:hypothetical protein